MYRGSGKREHSFSERLLVAKPVAGCPLDGWGKHRALCQHECVAVLLQINFLESYLARDDANWILQAHRCSAQETCARVRRRSSNLGLESLRGRVIGLAGDIGLAGSNSLMHAEHSPLRSSRVLVDTALKRAEQSFPTSYQRAPGSHAVASVRCALRSAALSCRPPRTSPQLQLDEVLLFQLKLLPNVVQVG